MRMTMTKGFQKKIAKNGSILKTYRAQCGWAKGGIAGGIILLVFGLLIGLPIALFGEPTDILTAVILIAPGLILTLVSLIMHKKRVNSYLDYFQKESGCSEAELQKAEQELMSPEAVKIGLGQKSSGGLNEIMYYITDHYFLSRSPVDGCYLRKLDDITAAFYSSEIPGVNGYRANLFLISRQDICQEGAENTYTKKQYRGFENGLMREKTDCRTVSLEVLEELSKRAPHIITSQKIAVNGVKYNLLSMDNWIKDWEKILEG